MTKSPAGPDRRGAEVELAQIAQIAGVEAQLAQVAGVGGVSPNGSGLLHRLDPRGFFALLPELP